MGSVPPGWPPAPDPLLRAAREPPQSRWEAATAPRPVILPGIGPPCFSLRRRHDHPVDISARAVAIPAARRSSRELTIRQSDSRDEPRILALLERHVTTERARPRYEWLYRKNPQGPAHSWVATRGDDIVGVTSIFAREFYVDGRPVMAGIGFDAYVLPAWRRRGIAVALHEASREAMVRGDVPFRFMCGPPTAANLAALVKAGSRIAFVARSAGLPLTARGLLWMLHWQNELAVRAAESSRVLEALVAGARSFATRSARVV